MDNSDWPTLGDVIEQGYRLVVPFHGSSNSMSQESAYYVDASGAKVAARDLSWVTPELIAAVERGERVIFPAGFFSSVYFLTDEGKERASKGRFGAYSADELRALAMVS